MLRKILGIKKDFSGGKKVSSQGEAFLTCLDYKDGDYCIAHCLEFDIVAQGKTFEQANESLAGLIKEQVTFAVEKDLEDTVLFHPNVNGRPASYPMDIHKESQVFSRPVVRAIRNK